MFKRQTIRKRIRFYGQVQAVGFRYTAYHAARKYGATGWVLNEYDGSVTMEIQGTQSQIDDVLAAIEKGLYIRVDRMEVKTVPTEENEHGFRVAY